MVDRAMTSGAVTIKTSQDARDRIHTSEEQTCSSKLKARRIRRKDDRSSRYRTTARNEWRENFFYLEEREN